MKKVVLFVAVLLLAGFVSLSAAEPAFAPAISLTGEASFTFGINLLEGNQATGIANASSTDLILTLVAADSNEKGGAEGEEVYGWIKLKTFKIVLDDDDSTLDQAGDTIINGSVDGIEAKLFLGPVYVNVLGLGDDDNIDKAGQISGYLVGNAYAGVGVAQAAEFNGIAIGLKDESILSFVVGVSSLFDWTENASTATADLNTNNVYNFYFGAGLKAVENLTFDVAANLSTGTGTSVGLGAKAGYKIGLAEGISIEPTVGLDIELPSGGATTPMQLTGILNLDLPGSDKNDSDIFGDGTDDFATGLKVVFTTDLAGGTQNDLGVYLFDGDLIPVLDVVGVVELADLGDTVAQTGIGVYASATIDVVSPWAKFYTSSVSGAANSAYTIIGAGVDLTVITNTTFTIGYSNKAAAGTTTEHTLTFTTKIAY
jgi:hypothetical protein